MDVDSPMPFGKYRGKDISALPSRYLRWIEENVENKPELVDVVQQELEYRDRHDEHHEEEP